MKFEITAEEIIEWWKEYGYRPEEAATADTVPLFSELIDKVIMLNNREERLKVLTWLYNEKW